MAVKEFFQAAKLHHLRHTGLFILPAKPAAAQYLKEIFAHGFFDEQRLRILRQHTHAAVDAHLPTVRLQQTGQHFQTGGFAGAVAAQQRHKLTLTHIK